MNSQANTPQAEMIPDTAEIIGAEAGYIRGDVYRLEKQVKENRVLLDRKRFQLQRYEAVVASVRNQVATLEANDASLRRIFADRQRLLIDIEQGQ